MRFLTYLISNKTGKGVALNCTSVKFTELPSGKGVEGERGLAYFRGVGNASA